MHSKLIAALLAPLLTSGCMMAGMAGMGGMGHMSGGGAHASGAAASTTGTMEVSEVVAGGLRVSAEFPAQLAGYSSQFAVVLRELDGRAITTDAAVFLDVAPVGASRTTAQPPPNHAAHPAKLAHAMPEDLARTRITPVARRGGQFEFHPTFAPDAVYLVTVVVERVGDRVMDPPISVSRVMQFAPRAASDSHAANAPWGGRAVPLAMLGAGLMTLMMLVTWR